MTKNVKKNTFQEGNQAAVKHGIYSFQNRGDKSLNPQRVGRLAELRELVQTQPGRQELREELAARCALIVDLAMADLVKTHNDGHSIWTSPVIKRMGTFMAELRRVLDTFPADEVEGTAAEIITQAIKQNERDT